MTPSTTARPHQLTQLHIPAEPAAWAAAGFAGGSQIRLGTTWLLPSKQVPEFAGSIDGIEELDGLTLAPAVSADGLVSKAEAEATGHANSATGIDHVVVMTPDCDRTTARFEKAGLSARRVRLIESSSGTRRQTFFWMGDVVCELVGPDEPSGDGPAKWWGLALTVEDIAGARAVLGERATDLKEAVQPGRHVCTIRSGADLVVPTLLISPHIPGVSSQSEG